MTRKDGSAYAGQWKAGKKDGAGIMTTADGERTMGDWKNDQYEGPGTLVMRGGKGVMTLTNGKRYAVILSSGDQKLVSISYIDG